MAALLAGFEYDIFISYRQKDNKYDGWVTEFVGNLRKELEATFKEDISIYFDENPHDGLLETHNVGRSLEGKLKSLILIPIISQTYCDPKSFAWQHEFVAFNEAIGNDGLGRSVRLSNGNIANRVLPVRIHDIDPADVKLYEEVTKEVLRPIDFIYRLPGVNRQLRARDDEQIKNAGQILYRDQINKVAHAIKDIIHALTHSNEKTPDRTSPKTKVNVEQGSAHAEARSKSRGRILAYTSPLIVILLLGYFVVPKWMNQRRARNELLPAIRKLIDDNFLAPTRAFELATEAEKYIPGDSSLNQLWPQVSRHISLETKPAGATLYWRNYDLPNDEWKLIGTTPINEARVPFSALYKIDKAGYDQVLTTSLHPVSTIKLDSIGTLPEKMVRIPSRTPGMFVVGLEQHKGLRVGEFLVDRFEVTNQEFKRFIDDGGYITKSYWPSPILSGGKQVSWESAMKTFVDKTGRPGPSEWEAGTYPNGQEDLPVAGVSWYEAAAFAAWAGKMLPTVYHWSVIAETGRAASIVPLSNFGGKGLSPVGTSQGISSFGIYDLAGNVREWCLNSSNDPAQRYILGGGWSDPTYTFSDAFSANVMDRSSVNGFRCIKILPGDTTLADISKPLAFEFRDFKVERPVDDKTFEIFLRQYAYDKSPPNARVELVADTGRWKVEKATMNAAYTNDQLFVYLFIPEDKPPPFQPIIYFPGSNAIYEDRVSGDEMAVLDFFVKSGRAFIYPVYKGTYERRGGLASDLSDESVSYRDHVIMWSKDMGRTIDYLETRPDMRVDQIGYFGFSWGSFLGGLIPAVEPRIKASVLFAGGLEMNKALPEADVLNFLPRVRQPTLMLNGRHDMFFPIETSQKPMFRLLGTPPEDKKIIHYESGHSPPRHELIKESLAWYDKYLGPAK